MSAEAAGVVIDRGRANDAAFTEVIAASSEEVRALARAVRDLVFDVLPQTLEVVWPRQGSVGWGTGEKKFTEQFAYLMPFKRHVTLGFYRGGELADPDGLLPERGREAGRRHPVHAEPQAHFARRGCASCPASTPRRVDARRGASARSP